MRELRACLVEYSVTRLRALAAARGVELTTNRHMDAARQLAAALTEPQSIAEALEILNAEERRALEAVQSAGGRVRADPFIRRFGSLRPIGDGRLLAEQPWLSPAVPTERLVYLGLLFKGFADYGGKTVDFFFIPTDVLPLLPPPRGTEPLPFRAVDEPFRIWSAGGSAAVDICAALALMQNQDVGYARGRGLPPKESQAWRRRWTWEGADPPPFAGTAELRGQFLLRAVSRLRLARRVGSLLKPRPDTARQWLNLPRAAQGRQMWEAWRADPGWDELRLIPSIRCEGTGWSNDPVVTRQRLLELLAGCEPGKWYSLPQTIQSIREHAPDFQRTGGDYTSWYIRDAESGQYLMGFEHWDAVEGRLVAQIVAGPMHWLGAADLGREGSDFLFCITPLGGAWLRGEKAGEDTPPLPLQIAPDAQVRWPADGNLYHRFQLERFAEPRAGGDGSLYVLTPGSLGRALAQGVNAEGIVRFLQRASEERLPAEVAASIREWAGRRGRAKLRRAMLLEVDSPQTMAAIRADPEIGPRLGEALSPTRAQVPEEAWHEVLALLRKKGFVA